MKKRTIILSLFLAIILSGCSSVIIDEQLPFYISDEVEFGIKEGDIIGRFGAAKEIKQGDLLILAYNTDNITGLEYEYMGIPYITGYGFGKENSLITVMHIINPDRIEANETSILFDEIDKKLTEKYSNSIASGEIWNNERYKDDSIMFAKALEEGHYEKLKIWEKEGVHIILDVKEQTVIYTNNVADIMMAKQKIEKMSNGIDKIPESYPSEEIPLYKTKRVVKTNEDDSGITIIYEGYGSYKETLEYYHKILVDKGGYIKQPLDNDIYLMTSLLSDLEKSITVMITERAEIDGVVTENPSITLMILSKDVYEEAQQNKYATEVTE